jgi:hypothetical protein
MVGRTLDWNDELGRWLKPFVDRLGHRARRPVREAASADGGLGAVLLDQARTADTGNVVAINR